MSTPLPRTQQRPPHVPPFRADDRRLNRRPVRGYGPPRLLTTNYARTRRWHAQLLDAAWLSAAVAVPLVCNPWGHSAFELPKAALLRALVLLMGLAALAGTTEGRHDPQRGRVPRRTHPLLCSALALGAALALATLSSVNPRTSLWGSYERQQGLLTWIAYLALFALTATHLRTRAQLEQLWAALVWGSVPVVACGLLQAAGLDPLGWQTDAASNVLSTIGRSNFLGSYLVLVVPLTAARLALSRRRLPHALLLAGQLACLALTHARAAWVGLGVVAVVGLAARAVTTRDRRPAMVALALVVAAGGLVALLNVPQRALCRAHLRTGPAAPGDAIPRRRRFHRRSPHHLAGHVAPHR